MLYLVSFLILLFAELCGSMHALYAVKQNSQGMAFFSALSSALWCIKIVVIINQPLTIITAFVGAYTGTLIAFHFNKMLDKITKNHEKKIVDLK